MATPEQITERLKDRIKSKDELKKFTRGWGGDIARNEEWTDEEHIKKNIERIVQHAVRLDELNELGMRLDFPSDQHAEYMRNAWTDRRSWIALIISVLALVISSIVLLLNLA